MNSILKSNKPQKLYLAQCFLLIYVFFCQNPRIHHRVTSLCVDQVLLSSFSSSASRASLTTFSSSQQPQQTLLSIPFLPIDHSTSSLLDKNNLLFNFILVDWINFENPYIFFIDLQNLIDSVQSRVEQLSIPTFPSHRITEESMTHIKQTIPKQLQDQK